MPVQLAGLGGFDSTGVISQLVTIAERPLRDIDTKRMQVDSATSTLNAFSTRLTSLKNAATALATPSGFSSMAATSSESGVVATVTGSSPGGSYSVEVIDLARAQKSRGDANASATTALGHAGTFTIQVGASSTVTVDIVETDTLSDVANKISQSGARVSAGVINAGGSYRLSIQGLDSGAENAVTFGETGGVSLGFSDPASVIEAAQDARLEIDGLTVTRSTNQVADAIPGVTLALTKATTTTISVARDTSALKSKLSSFVAAYNDVVNAGHSATGYGTTKASNPVLAADSGVRRSLDRIASLVSGQIPGSAGTYRSLAAVGISLSRDGTMSFDAAKLDAALEKDPESVRRLFVTDSSTGATGVMKSLSDAINGLVTGEGAPLKSRLDSLSAQSKRLVESRAKKEEAITKYEQQLRRQFANLDQAMSRYQTMSSALAGLNSMSMTNK